MNVFLTTKERRAVNARNHFSRAELVYLVTDIAAGTTDAEILQQVSDASPAAVGYAPRVETRISARPGQKSCEVTVSYSPDDDGDTSLRIVKRAGDEIWLIFAQTGREKRFHAFATQCYGVGSATAPDPKNWIRWNGGFGSDFRAEGAWIHAPKMQEKCIRTFDPDQLTGSYRRIVMESIGKVNQAPFRNWAKGEVLLLEAQQSKEYRNEKGDWLTDVTFLFGISPNGTRSTGQQTVSVGGWQVLWGIAGIDDSWDIKNSAFYVSTVYEECDFSRLRIGKGDSGTSLRRRIRDLQEE